MPRKSLRVRVEDRAQERCEYCYAPQSVCGYRFHLEHIVPLAAGGLDTEDNRALACASCNLAKSEHTSGRDPLTAAPRLCLTLALKIGTSISPGQKISAHLLDKPRQAAPRLSR